MRNVKKKLLEKKKYPAVCETCLHGRLSPDERTVLCVKKGIVETDGKCRRYSYDPLKRRPKKPLLIERADPSEFDLSIDSDNIPPSPQTVFKEPEQSAAGEKSEVSPDQEPDAQAEHTSKHGSLFEPVKLFEDSDF